VSAQKGSLSIEKVEIGKIQPLSAMPRWVWNVQIDWCLKSHHRTVVASFRGLTLTRTLTRLHRDLRQSERLSFLESFFFESEDISQSVFETLPLGTILYPAS
jgi:hypothetical protein